MDKRKLQRAQNVIDALFYDDKALTQSQHNLLEDVIELAQTKVQADAPDVSSRARVLAGFVLYLEMHGFIDMHSFNYEKEIDRYLRGKE